MLKYILSLTLILQTFISLTYAFDCPIASTSPQCSELSGCNWNGNSCIGSYVPSCSPTTCYFIYPSGSNSQNPQGTKTDPFSTLTQALTTIGSGNGIIFVVSGSN